MKLRSASTPGCFAITFNAMQDSPRGVVETFGAMSFREHGLKAPFTERFCSTSAEKPTAAYIPRGVAHDFLGARGPATLVYKVSSEYDANLDAGICWDSFGLDWPVRNPQTSARDTGFPVLRDFNSPFYLAPLEVPA